jgi:hypothetical protein
MNTTNYFFSVTWKTCRNALYHGNTCHAASRSCAVRYRPYELQYSISNRTYSSRARTKALAKSKARPKQEFQPANKSASNNNETSPGAFMKESSPATAKKDEPTRKPVSGSSKDTVVSLGRPAPKYGRHNMSLQFTDYSQINSISRKAPHMERRCIQNRSHRPQQHRSTHLHGLGLLLLGPSLHNVTRNGRLVCHTRYVFCPR